MPDRLRETIDQFIGGRKGEWYWEIETGGSQFGGGMFYRIEDARQHMIERLIARVQEIPQRKVKARA